MWVKTTEVWDLYGNLVKCPRKVRNLCFRGNFTKYQNRPFSTVRFSVKEAW